MGATKIATVLQQALLQYPLNEPSLVARRQCFQLLGQQRLAADDRVNRSLATLASRMP
jgi:hypothetical protein